MNLKALRAGLAARLATIEGLHVWAYNPDAIVPPAAVVLPRSIEYHRAFDEGCSRIVLRVRVYVQKVSDRASQDALDDMLASTGTKSLRAAIEEDPTLGGVCTSVMVMFAEDSYANYQVGETQYSGFELNVEVMA